MKAIMYHYVRPFDSEYPNLKNLNIDDFRKQLDYFQAEFGFVSKEDFINSFKTGKPVNGVILTFDDALYCHYEYAYKEFKRLLKKYKNGEKKQKFSVFQKMASLKYQQKKKE